MKKERIFWGILLILGSIGLIASKLGYFSDINVFNVILTVFLGVIIIKSLLKLNFVGVLFPIAFICIIYDEQLGITAITPWTILLAALLGSIGFSLIFSKKPQWYYKKYSLGNYNNYNLANEETIDIEDEGKIRLQTSFASSIKYINTDQFESVDLKCNFGSMKVYFDNATLRDGKGVVKIDSNFSGVELYIPKTWKIENRTSAQFGGIDEKNRNQQSSNNVLTFVGNISFSGVEIIYI